MPLPVILIAGAAIAGATGVVNGATGAKKMVETKGEQKEIAKQHTRNTNNYEIRLSVATQAMDTLGEAEMQVLADFSEFSDVIEQIENRPEFGEIIRDDFQLPDLTINDIKEISVGAIAVVGGMGGVAAGTFGGFAAAGATTSAVMALGTASTGTAIASLSGAAATNATLAALGGGAIAAGGGGIALGTTVLGVTTAGVGLMVGGIIFHITGSTLKKKTEEAKDAVDKETEEVEKVCFYLEELSNVATNYYEAVKAVKRIYDKHFARLQYTVLVEGKKDYRTFTETDKLAYSNTVLLVGILYDMLKVNLVNEREDDLNEINYIAMHDSIDQAAKYMSNDPLANERVKETVSRDLKKQAIDFSVYDLPEEEEKEGVLDQIGKGISDVQAKAADSWEKMSPQLKEGAEKTGKMMSQFAGMAKDAASKGGKSLKDKIESAKKAKQTQKVSVGGKNLLIPSYYKRVESRPDDPAGSVSFMYRTDNSLDFVMLYPVEASESLPRDTENLRAGIREYLSENQGLIYAEADAACACSIIKTLRQPSGVQYTLTCQLFYEDMIIQVQGFFEEEGTTGVRETAVFEICRRENLVGAPNNPVAGWVADPYDPFVTEGALMNQSEKEEYDAMFPGFPLTVCREFVGTIREV